jgi:hypothetical protein
MLLSEIFEYISHGELANLVFTGKDEGTIRERDYAKIISNINLGLIALHKRFPILYKQVQVQMYGHITQYMLHSDYAISNTASTKPYKYIIDGIYNSFKDDIIKVDRIVNEGCCEYPLNDDTNPLSLFTPSYNVIQVPYPIEESAFSVEYQAYPSKIPTSVTEPETVEVELPEFLLEPLISFINYKMYTRTGLEKPEAVNFLQKYEVECKLIETSGLFNKDNSSNLRLESNQWV